jgi:hypothetical protein
MASKGYSKALLTIVSLTVCASAVAFGQPSETRCIRTTQISEIKRAKDGTFIDFRMSGGKTYRSTLRNKCPGIKSSGIGYQTRGTASLCKGETVRVLKTGGVCILGPFVEVSQR